MWTKRSITLELARIKTKFIKILTSISLVIVKNIIKSVLIINTENKDIPLRKNSWKVGFLHEPLICALVQNPQSRHWSEYKIRFFVNGQCYRKNSGYQNLYIRKIPTNNIQLLFSERLTVFKKINCIDINQISITKRLDDQFQQFLKHSQNRILWYLTRGNFCRGIEVDGNFWNFFWKHKEKIDGKSSFPRRFPFDFYLLFILWIIIASKFLKYFGKKSSILVITWLFAFIIQVFFNLKIWFGPWKKRKNYGQACGKISRFFLN